MRRTIAFVYGTIAYGMFFGVFLYLIGFVENLIVPKSIDTGEPAPLGETLLVNVALIALFAAQHSVMARPAFKAWWTKFIPKPVERSTYVLLASLVLALLFWQWRPLPDAVWHFDDPLARAVLLGVSFVGWFTVLYSSFIIDHFDLFGLRQVFLYLRDRPYTHPPFAVRSLYRIVRHPLMLGILIGVWVTPTMTAGHLLFSVLLTGYIVVGVMLEERDLARTLGRDYLQYREKTPMFVPSLPRGKLPGAPRLTRGA